MLVPRACVLQLRTRSLLAPAFGTTDVGRRFASWPGVLENLPRRFATLGWYHARCSEPTTHVAVVVLAVELRIRQYYAKRSNLVGGIHEYEWSQHRRTIVGARAGILR